MHAHGKRAREDLRRGAGEAQRAGGRDGARDEADAHARGEEADVDGGAVAAHGERGDAGHAQDRGVGDEDAPRGFAGVQGEPAQDRRQARGGREGYGAAFGALSGERGDGDLRGDDIGVGGMRGLGEDGRREQEEGEKDTRDEEMGRHGEMGAGERRLGRFEAKRM